MLIAETVEDYIERLSRFMMIKKNGMYMSTQGQKFVIKNYSLTSNTFLLGKLWVVLTITVDPSKQLNLNRSVSLI